MHGPANLEALKSEVDGKIKAMALKKQILKDNLNHEL